MSELTIDAITITRPSLHIKEIETDGVKQLSGDQIWSAAGFIPRGDKDFPNKDICGKFNKLTLNFGAETWTFTNTQITPFCNEYIVVFDGVARSARSEEKACEGA